MDTKINQKEDWEWRFRYAYEGANSSSKSVDSMCDFIRQELNCERKQAISDFVHTTTDLFGEGTATDNALIVADHLRNPNNEK